MVKLQDLLFWILIALIVGIAIWKLMGSPTDTAALIAIALFVAGSEILIWRALFNIDKKTCVGFEKVKLKLDIMNKEVKNINNNLNKLLARK